MFTIKCHQRNILHFKKYTTNIFSERETVARVPYPRLTAHRSTPVFSENHRSPFDDGYLPNHYQRLSPPNFRDNAGYLILLRINKSELR